MPADKKTAAPNACTDYLYCRGTRYDTLTRYMYLNYLRYLCLYLY